MIRAIRVRDVDKACCPWWEKVPALAAITELAFAPDGLTILFGPNGVGKSTILRTLARHFHCEQAGIPTVTESSVWNLFPKVMERDFCLDGIDVEHDGQPVHFFDPASTPGLVGGAFDDDFFDDGLAQIGQRRSSAGQRVMAALGRIFHSAEMLSEVRNTLKRERVNELWQAYLDGVERMLAPTRDPSTAEPLALGRRTILLDEPDRSLSLPNQRILWEKLARPQRFQIIVATHSVFALDVPGATYIDLKPGYLAKAREALASLLPPARTTP